MSLASPDTPPVVSSPKQQSSSKPVVDKGKVII